MSIEIFYLDADGEAIFSSKKFTKDKKGFTALPAENADRDGMVEAIEVRDGDRVLWRKKYSFPTSKRSPLSFTFSMREDMEMLRGMLATWDAIEEWA